MLCSDPYLGKAMDLGPQIEHLMNSATYESSLTLFTPTGSDGWRLYEYITRHFIATVSQDCKYLQTTIDFNIGTEAFSCSGKTLISPGTDIGSASHFTSIKLLMKTPVNCMQFESWATCSCKFLCICRLHNSDELAGHPSGRSHA